MAVEKKVAVVPVDTAELAARIIEAFTGRPRPAGMSGVTCLENCPPAVVAAGLRAGEAASNYWFECMKQVLPDTEMFEAPEKEGTH